MIEKSYLKILHNFMAISKKLFISIKWHTVKDLILRLKSTFKTKKIGYRQDIQIFSSEGC